MGYSVYLRNPRTFNEARLFYQTTFNEFGIEISVRSKRTPKYLPNSWDDVKRNYNQRNWKGFRKTQWK